MRALLTTLGMMTIGVYAILGAFLMNDWAIVAASELPLDQTIAELNAAHQPLDTTAGIIFAVLGIVLALTWGVLTLHPRIAFAAWASLLSWAGIVAFGAPAYFFASFGNLNSVGDTFYDWNSQAAFALVSPLYLVSSVAFLLAVAVGMATFIRTLMRQRPVPA